MPLDTTQWRIQGGTPGAQILLITLRTKIFLISCSCWENPANLYICAPPPSWRPLLRGILYPPLLQDTDNKQAVRILLEGRLVSSSCQSEDKLGSHLINHHEKQTLLLRIVKLNRQLCFIDCLSSNQVVHLPQGQRVNLC